MSPRRTVSWQAAAADDRLARMAWSRLAEPDSVGVAMAIAEAGGHGPALRQLGLGRSPLTSRLRGRMEALDVGADCYLAERADARVVVPGDDEWPTRLDRLAQPPHCLWVRGPNHLAEVTRRSVAIVGARASTAYGDNVAGDMAVGMCERGFTVVSGAAYGIDGAAHRGALAVDGLTVAVLATGVDLAYPSGHDALLQRIALTGNVISEAAPMSKALGSRFLKRNRLIAVLSCGTVVVEAGLRSGSLNTANWAQKHLAPVGVVPGPVSSMVSAGCHEAIREGYATLVTDAAEVAELVGRIGLDLAEPKRGPEYPEDLLPEREQRVWEALPGRGTMTVADLIFGTTLEPGQVQASLGRLELAGLVRSEGPGLWKRVPRPRDRPARVGG